MINFVAIDFETANKYANSACSLAVVTVENGQITKRGYSLIKPPFMRFNRRKSWINRHLINYGRLFMKIT